MSEFAQVVTDFVRASLKQAVNQADDHNSDLCCEVQDTISHVETQLTMTSDLLAVAYHVDAKDALQRLGILRSNLQRVCGKMHIPGVGDKVQVNSSGTFTYKCKTYMLIRLSEKGWKLVDEDNEVLALFPLEISYTDVGKAARVVIQGHYDLMDGRQ